MSSSLNISLTDELRNFVNSRASDQDLYATPSEYIRDLIRQDMANRYALSQVMRGLADVRNKDLSGRSILDIGNETQA